MGGVCSQQKIVEVDHTEMQMDKRRMTKRMVWDTVVNPEEVPVSKAVQSWLQMAPPPGSACFDTLHKVFPGSLPGMLVLQRVAAATEPYGLTPENTIYGQSVCPDEINHEKGGLAHSMAEYWGECFPMGGIGGAPYVGKTGFMAFSHHVPDDGHVLVLFGPHIAISDSGELGKILRVGQCKESGACGAVLAAYDSCCKGCSKEFEETDMQQWWLREQIGQKFERIKAAETPLQELMAVAYESVKEKLEAIVNNDFGTGNLVLVGGIQINMPAPYRDHFYPMMFEVRQKDGRKVDLLERIHQVNFGGQTVSLV